MPVLRVSLGADRLQVGSCRQPGGHLHSIPRLEPLPENLQVKSADSGDNQLSGAIVPLRGETNIFLNQLDVGFGEFLFVRLGLGSGRQSGHGAWNTRRRHRALRVGGEIIEGVQTLDLDQGANLSSPELFDCLLLLALESNELPRLLRLPCMGIQEEAILADRP